MEVAGACFTCALLARSAYDMGAGLDAGAADDEADMPANVQH